VFRFVELLVLTLAFVDVPVYVVALTLLLLLVEVLVAEDVVLIFVVVSSAKDKAGHNKHVITNNRFMLGLFRPCD